MANKKKKKAAKKTAPAPKPPEPALPAVVECPAGVFPFRSLRLRMKASLFSAFTDEKLRKLGATLLDSALAGDAYARSEVLRLVEDMDASQLDEELQDVGEARAGRFTNPGEPPLATFKDAELWPTK